MERPKLGVSEEESLRQLTDRIVLNSIGCKTLVFRLEKKPLSRRVEEQVEDAADDGILEGSLPFWG